MIKVEHLTKTFKKVNAVNDISFEVHEGEIVGLLGENGAGKTTTLRILATLMQPTHGHAWLNGYEIKEHPESVRQEIGILFGGDVALYDRLTGRENMIYFAKLNGMNEQQAQAQVDLLAKKLEMETYIDRKVGKYSRGMKQKVSLARSIIHDPHIMLFDEPSTGLDVFSTRLVHQFILDCKKENRAILFSSHNMYEVEKLCDRIIIINKGELVDSGTLDELKARYHQNNLEDLFVELIGGDLHE